MVPKLGTGKDSTGKSLAARVPVLAPLNTTLSLPSPFRSSKRL